MSFLVGQQVVKPWAFLNTSPALAVLCIGLGLGLIGRDGMFLTVGIGASGLILGLLVLAVIAGGPVVEALLQWLPGPVRVYLPLG